MKMKGLFGLAAGLLLAGSLQSAAVVAVLSGASGPYKEALEGLKAALGEIPSATLPALPDMAGGKVVVTFGSEAALKDYPGSAALVAALTAARPEERPASGAEALAALTALGVD